MKIYRKIAAAALSAVLVLGCAVTVNAYVCKQGDANSDGKVSISDATTIQQYLINKVTYRDMNYVASEVNGDGRVTIADATFLQKQLAGLDAEKVGFAPLDGIDVSDWQEDVDFERIKADGYDFVIIHAGYGNEISQKDKRFEQHYKSAKDAGLLVGTYWYSYATDPIDAQLEAKVFMQAIAGKTFEMPVFYDVEDSMHLKYSKADLTAITNSFCKTMSDNNYLVGVYSNQNFFNNYIDIPSLTSTETIWLAEYDNTMNIECDVWQYASDGTVNGCDGEIDMNKCLKNYPEIIMQNGYNGF